MTKQGKERNIYRNNIVRNSPYTDDVNDIVRTLSKKEKQLLGADPKKKDWIEKEYETELWQTRVKHS